MAAHTLRIAALAVALVAAPAIAAGPAATAERLILAEASRASVAVSRDEAAEVARAATGGRVLRVELERNGAPVYRVRVLIDGERVRSVAVDARTGRVRD